MARRSTPQAPRTNGFAWGPERVRLGLSMTQLSELSGVSKPMLSLVEAGRIVPTGADYRAVTKALRAEETAQGLRCQHCGSIERREIVGPPPREMTITVCQECGSDEP